MAPSAKKITAQRSASPHTTPLGISKAPSSSRQSGSSSTPGSDQMKTTPKSAIMIVVAAKGVSPNQSAPETATAAATSPIE